MSDYDLDERRGGDDGGYSDPPSDAEVDLDEPDAHLLDDPLPEHSLQTTSDPTMLSNGTSFAHGQQPNGTNAGASSTTPAGINGNATGNGNGGPARRATKNEQLRAKRIPDADRSTTPYLTKYERARVLGARATQISLNAPVLVDLEGETDPLEIAKKELAAKRLPLVVRRFLPDGAYEDWAVRELIL